VSGDAANVREDQAVGIRYHAIVNRFLYVYFTYHAPPRVDSGPRDRPDVQEATKLVADKLSIWFSDSSPSYRHSVAREIVETLAAHELQKLCARAQEV